MKILYDHQAFVMQRYGGVSRCFTELYAHMPQGVQAQFSLLESDNAYCSELGIGHSKDYDYCHFIFPFHWPAKGRMFRAYNRVIGRDGNYQDKWEYNRKESIRLLRKGRFDVFHPTFFDDYFLQNLNGKPFVLTIHDMIPELYPQYNSRDDFQIRMKRKLAPLASAIVAVSETTKKDVIRILGVPEEKVHVVYHGCSFPKVKETYSFYQQPYILYVGGRWSYKNFVLFVRHIVPLLERHKDFLVVCTGSPFDEKELVLFEEMKLSGRFVYHWAKNDMELYSLYHHAECFVYPSDYEGFGIPILEAYQANCPVVLNSASCFPEIAGDAAVFFEINSKQSNLSDCLEQVLAMSIEDRNELLSRQRTRLKAFSWQLSAMKLSQVYKSVLEQLY